MGIEIHFVTGKGGVGKSNVALAMALAMAKTGKKTLLVELATESFFQESLGIEVTSKPATWKKNLDLAVWNGSSCLREYALYLLKAQALYRLFFENVVTKSLIQVAPGLAEIAMLGKITSGPPRNVGLKLDYQALVIDAFASGHFMALLRSPFGLSQAIKFGPMGDQARSIINVIKDSKICKYHVVTLAEELPIQEGLELTEQIHQLLGVESEFILNRMIGDEGEHTASPRKFQEYLKTISGRQAHARSKLIPKFQELPWILEPNFESVAQKLSEVIHV